MVERIVKLKKYIKSKDTAFLITSDVNRFYITGFKSSAGAVFVTSDNTYLLLDFRYFEAAQKSVSNEITLICYSKLVDSINEIITNNHIKSIIVEEEYVTISDFNKLKDNLNADILNDKLSYNLSQIRLIKDKTEISYIKQAQKITEKSFNEILNYVKPGITEKKLSVELEYLMKIYGADDLSFDIIAISGVNTSLPHGVPSDKKIANNEFITFDIGVKYNGYCSDMTRTIAIGDISEQMHDIYNIVLQAHNRAADMIKSGNMIADVDLAAREYIESMGYGEYFGHSTGHGVGLEIHEAPTVYKTNKEKLKENMIITDEPGIYLPNKFGVRIEDMYLVTVSGYEDLATIDKELIIV